jgi:O-antigen ligase
MRSLSPYRTIEGVAAFGAPVAAFGLGVFSSSDREQRSWNARTLLLFAIAFSAWGLITYNPAEALRLSAHLGSANTAACIYGMLAVFSAACLARAALRKGWQDAPSMSEHLSGLARASPLAVAALVMSLACVALTLSRGGIAAAAAGFAVLMTCLIVREGRTPGRRAAFYLTAFGALLAIAGYVMFKRNALSAAALNGRGDAVSFEDRQILIEIYWRAFLDRPAFGHGVNTYHEISTLAADPQTWEALRSSGSVHNIYVQALAESGAIGAALLGLAFLVPLWRGFRRAFSGDEWAAGAVAMSVLCLAQGLVDFGLQTPAIAALWAFCLGAFALKRSRRAG